MNPNGTQTLTLKLWDYSESSESEHESVKDQRTSKKIKELATNIKENFRFRLLWKRSLKAYSQEEKATMKSENDQRTSKKDQRKNGKHQRKNFAFAFAFVWSEHGSIVNKEKRSPWGARRMAKFTYLKMTGTRCRCFSICPHWRRYNASLAPRGSVWTALLSHPNLCGIARETRKHYGVLTLRDTETETDKNWLERNCAEVFILLRDANFHWVPYTFYWYLYLCVCLGVGKCEWTISVAQ